jgi:two-component system LytT family response regulator
MKRIAIIDDEPDARQALSTLLTTFCPEVDICGEADSVASAFVLLRQTQPQAILLDISLGDGTGFDLLDKFPQLPFQVIFTTAHDDFALKAFRYHALDYLLKPINPVELAAAIDRVQKAPPADYPTRISHLLESHRTQQLSKITLTTQQEIIFVKIDQIVHLESEGSYTTFHLLNKERHLISHPLKTFEEMLPVADFFKLHQSHLINLSHVKSVLREDGGYVLMEDGNKIPIARRRKEEFLKVLKERFRG